MGSLVLRWTLWESETGEPLQLSLMILDSSWEPLAEFTKPCGPFHSAEDQRHVLLDDMRRYLRTTGIQLELA